MQPTRTAPLLPEVAPLREASRQMVRELGFLDSGTRARGITHSQCHALIELERRPGATAGEIAELLRLDKSTTSRLVASLLRRKLVRVDASPGDRRRRLLALTPRGRAQLREIHASANRQVQEALALLAPDERRSVVDGVATYARALARKRAQQGYRIREIERRDDAAIARIIRTVMPEFGASGEGFAINDPEVDWMSRAYGADRGGSRRTPPGRGGARRYLVVERDGVVVGGGGFAPLEGGPRGVCELRKMYFLPEARGAGMGRRLLSFLLDEATAAGYETCYLETLGSMTQARRLYESVGFRPSKAMGATGHFGCDAWYTKPLGAR